MTERHARHPELHFPMPSGSQRHADPGFTPRVRTHLVPSGESRTQHEALLRLMQEEEGHVKAMVTATGKEVELWRERLPAPVGQAAASSEIRTAAQTARPTIALREQGNDAAADDLLVRYAKEASPKELVALSWEYQSLSFFELATDRDGREARNERGPRAVDRDV
ncbi:hypothetical protein ACIGW7_11650 [Streptomyces sp. NPDC053253]|uniref:hypothetical protein n=1 Tax=Streptomyces sp. NPDC053253 TaxID=3365699 RepID=UPI0037CE747B